MRGNDDGSNFTWTYLCIMQIGLVVKGLWIAEVVFALGFALLYMMHNPLSLSFFPIQSTSLPFTASLLISLSLFFFPSPSWCLYLLVYFSLSLSLSLSLPMSLSYICHYISPFYYSFTSFPLCFIAPILSPFFLITSSFSASHWAFSSTFILRSSSSLFFCRSQGGRRHTFVFKSLQWSE